MDENHEISQLLDAVKSGDKIAFKALYDKYGGALYSLAKKVVTSDEVAQDILQEAMIKIWNNISHYDESKGRLFTWMARIVKNTAIDFLRKKSVRYEIQSSEAIVSNYERDSHMGQNPDTLDIHQHVNSLIPEQQQVIDILYFKGRTHQEASDELALPLGTIKTRVRAAMKELKRIFEATP
ncbi:MAG: sigma-70 family RNA polymerase sigma factor [Schleiferiaceae bacterium]|nr:sigma-70 family RNA polymerase sigma factor [Schleiferiaceae bacterium]